MCVCVCQLACMGTGCEGCRQSRHGCWSRAQGLHTTSSRSEIWVFLFMPLLFYDDYGDDDDYDDDGDDDYDDDGDDDYDDDGDDDDMSTFVCPSMCVYVCPYIYVMSSGVCVCPAAEPGEEVVCMLTAAMAHHTNRLQTHRHTRRLQTHIRTSRL